MVLGRAWFLFFCYNYCQMTIYIGADHRGFKMKEALKVMLEKRGYPVFDCGALSYDDADDYPDFAEAVARKVSEMPARLAEASGEAQEDAAGILICGSGAGICVAANKFKNVRAAIGISTEQAKAARTDDHINIICLASDYITEDEAAKIVVDWLNTPFSQEERHLRRIKKISNFEAR